MTSPVIQVAARLLLGPSLMVAFAVLVKGYTSAGDGFAAGAIAAMAVLLHYAAFGQAETERVLPIRRLPAASFVALGAALALAAAPLAVGDALLTYAPPPGAKPVYLGSLELVGAFAFDVSVFVLVTGAALGIVHSLARQAEEDNG